MATPSPRAARRRSRAMRMPPAPARTLTTKNTVARVSIVSSSSQIPSSSNCSVMSVRLLFRPSLPCTAVWSPAGASPLVRMANESARLSPSLPPPPARIDSCVRCTALRKIERNVSVSIAASSATSTPGRKLLACWLPASTSCSVRRFASSLRTDCESRGATARWLKVWLSKTVPQAQLARMESGRSTPANTSSAMLAVLRILPGTYCAGRSLDARRRATGGSEELASERTPAAGVSPAAVSERKTRTVHPPSTWRHSVRIRSRLGSGDPAAHGRAR